MKFAINQDCDEDSRKFRKTCAEFSTHQMLPLLETRFGSLMNLVNCLAYMCRLSIDFNRGKLLSLAESEAATESIVKIVQRQMFPFEHRCFMRKMEDPPMIEKFPSKSPLLRLSSSVNERRISRVGESVRERNELTYQQKHPIVLSKCFFLELITRHLHKKFHADNNIHVITFNHCLKFSSADATGHQAAEILLRSSRCCYQLLRIQLFHHVCQRISTKVYNFNCNNFNWKIQYKMM